MVNSIIYNPFMKKTKSLSGGVLSINVDPTKVDITAWSGYLKDAKPIIDFKTSDKEGLEIIREKGMEMSEIYRILLERNKGKDLEGILHQTEKITQEVGEWMMQHRVDNKYKIDL